MTDQEEAGRKKRRTLASLAVPPLPHPSATGSLTQEALELCYRLLMNEKEIPGAAGLVVLLIRR